MHCCEDCLPANAEHVLVHIHHPQNSQQPGFNFQRLQLQKGENFGCACQAAMLHSTERNVTTAGVRKGQTCWRKTSHRSMDAMARDWINLSAPLSSTSEMQAGSKSAGTCMLNKVRLFVVKTEGCILALVRSVVCAHAALRVGELC